ncbi:MAG: hypothetical protein HC873_08350 [Leptolyngbyaceae cyanobacterium SL_1_1]|nr:hypothetical protein [Leptolyngbyaceae cyanobacterium RM1_1_2]NJO09654.1 hypothetical protein [Leptolyngbyaceae cyanobacterium SL_1_1]
MNKASQLWIQAIAQANTAADDDLIDLSWVKGAIALQSPLPAITHNLTLVGNGDDTISGSGDHRWFEHNRAIAGAGYLPGQGKGGAIFVMPNTLAQPDLAVPRVCVLGKLPAFADNMASNAATLATDNNNVYGAIAPCSLKK